MLNGLYTVVFGRVVKVNSYERAGKDGGAAIPKRSVTIEFMGKPGQIEASCDRFENRAETAVSSAAGDLQVGEYCGLRVNVFTGKNDRGPWTMYDLLEVYDKSECDRLEPVLSPETAALKPATKV